jgi:RimJ/RimL family protein N-acetyltransferase
LGLPEVQIRSLEFKDLEDFIKIRNSVSKMLHNSAKFNLEECQKWFETSEQKYFVVDGLDLGLIGYFRIRFYEDQEKCAEIGLDLNPKFHGRKWAKPLYKLFVKQILLPAQTKKVTLRVIRKNLRAIQLYKSMGFEIYEESKIDFAMHAPLSTLVNKLSQNLADRNSIST